MYGTVARMRTKPGMERELTEHMREFEEAKVPGIVATYTYRMDSDPNEYYVTVVFDSRESYWANAQNPEQDARYRRLVELLVSEPEWHDGEIIYSHIFSGARAA